MWVSGAAPARLSRARNSRGKKSRACWAAEGGTIVKANGVTTALAETLVKVGQYAKMHERAGRKQVAEIRKRK